MGGTAALVSWRVSADAPGGGVPSMKGRPMLLDYAAAAEYLSTTERHVRDLQQRRELTSVRVGRLVRFRTARPTSTSTSRRTSSRHGERRR